MDFRDYLEMKQPAGAFVLPIASTGRMLLGFRALGGDPNTWAAWGGSAEENETPKQTAQRELAEETGFSGKIKLIPLYVLEYGDRTFHHFLGLVDEEFKPRLNDEHSKAKWLYYADAQKITPHHPSLKESFKRKKVKELCDEQVSWKLSRSNLRG